MTDQHNCDQNIESNMCEAHCRVCGKLTDQHNCGQNADKPETLTQYHQECEKRKEALNRLTKLSQEYGLYDSPKITRVEVIDRTKQVDEGGGRVYTNYDVNDAWVSYQDGGRTLKVFINESGTEETDDLIAFCDEYIKPHYNSPNEGDYQFVKDALVARFNL